MEDSERERLEDIIAAVSIASNPEQVKEEIGELNELAIHAKRVEDSGTEAKLSRLREAFAATRLLRPSATASTDIH